MCFTRSGRTGTLIKRMIGVITLVAMVVSGSGCTKLVRVPASEVSPPETDTTRVDATISGIKEIRLKSGETVKFAKPGAHIPAGSNKLVGVTKRGRVAKHNEGGEPFEISVDSIQTFAFREPNPIATAVLVAGLAAGVFIMVELATHPIGIGSWRSH